MKKKPASQRTSFGNGNKNVGELLSQCSGLEELRGVDVSIVLLDGFGHDDDGGVAFLDRLSGGRDGAGDVARLEGGKH